MKQARSTAALSLLAVFVCGIVVGVFGHRVYAVKSVSATLAPQPPPNPEQWRKQYVAEMTTRLGLQADQVAKVNVILDETRTKMEALKAQGHAERKAIYEAQVARIDTLLNDQQKVEYGKLREERRQRRLEREKQQQSR